MSGLLINERFVAVFPSLVRLLGSIEAAVILQHLHFNADDEGDIKITRQQISDETGIGFATVTRRIGWLRDEGWISSERSARFDSTLVYRIDHSKLRSSRGEDPTPESGNLQLSDSGNLATSSIQKVRTSTTEISLGNEGLQPHRHPSRQITKDAIRPEWFDHLRETYPHVDLTASAHRFLNYHLSKQDTSKSWEALLENWVSNDNERAEQQLREGTDDLGVPRSQKRKSAVPDAPRPGDPDYFDPEQYLQQVQEAGK